MDFKKIVRNTLADQKTQLESFTSKDWAWTVGLGSIILWGLYALYLQIVKGHGITGMRDNVVWGLYIANFIFFIGISYAGAIISSLLHLFKVEWGKPIIRIVKLMSVVSVIIGPIFILLCIGRLDRLHHLFIYTRLQSPITWDVIAIITFLSGAFIYLYLSLIRDFSILDHETVQVGRFRKKIYKILSLGFNNTETQRAKLKASLNIIALIMIPLVVVVSSVLSWIFGMTLRPGWHSTIFGPYFVLASIYSGTGVLILAMYFYRRYHHLSTYITAMHFKNVGYMMAVLGAAYGYFTFSEYLTDWYTSETWNAELMHKLLDWDEFGPFFLFANVGGIVLPLTVIAIPKFRTINMITAAAAVMVLAMWVKRYLIVVPTLEATLLPMQDTRAEYVHYSATWVEWALTFAGLAAFILMFKLAAKVIPIVPVWVTSESIVRSDKQNKTEKTASKPINHV